jgi:hypothetical protein
MSLNSFLLTSGVIYFFIISFRGSCGIPPSQSSPSSGVFGVSDIFKFKTMLKPTLQTSYATITVKQADSLQSISKFATSRQRYFSKNSEFGDAHVLRPTANSRISYGCMNRDRGCLITLQMTLIIRWVGLQISPPYVKM